MVNLPRFHVRRFGNVLHNKLIYFHGHVGLTVSDGAIIGVVRHDGLKFRTEQLLPGADEEVAELEEPILEIDFGRKPDSVSTHQPFPIFLSTLGPIAVVCDYGSRKADHLLNLNTGLIDTSDKYPLDRCPYVFQWSIGIRASSNEFMPLIGPWGKSGKQNLEMLEKASRAI